MDIGAPTIPQSRLDLERERLEASLERDLSSLSISLSNAASSSFASQSSLGMGRSAAVHDYRPTFDSTPRAPRNPSFATSFASAGVGASPASTAGHHVSAATLGAGVFNTRRPERTTDEFDPDRSLGRLVTQLTRAMEEENINKPSSPFQRSSPQFQPQPQSQSHVHHRSHSPRSPSPPQQQQQYQNAANLSWSINRNDPLPSPPASRTVSAASSKSSGSGSGRPTYAAPAPTTSYAAPAPRAPLVDTGRHNLKATDGWNGIKAPERSLKAPLLVPHIVQPTYQPTRNARSRADETSDVTGMTQLLATPAKGVTFEGLDKNAAPETAGANIPSALASMRAQISALQNENAVATDRIAQLEAEIQAARDDVQAARRNGDESIREVLNEKKALEDLVAMLRANLASLTSELEAQKAILVELRSVRHVDESVRDDIACIKRDIERLTRDVAQLNDIAKQGLLARSAAREARSMRVDALDLAEGVARVAADVTRHEQRQMRTATTQTDALPSQLRQGIHAAGATEVGLMPPSAKAVRILSSDSEGEAIASPTPSSRRSASRASRYSASPPPPPQVDAFRPAREEQQLSPAAQRAEHELRERQRRAKERRERAERSSEKDVTPNNSNSSHRSRRNEGPMSPFPSIRAEDELEFFSPRHSPRTSPHASLRVDRSAVPVPRGLSKAADAHTARPSAPPVNTEAPASRIPSATSAKSAASAATVASGASKATAAGAPTVRAILEGSDVPPATVLTRVIGELEADFAHYKSIYVELADQYKVLDCASAVAKRHVLAAHLKEVIDCLETKADQVAALYSLLSVADRPASPTGTHRPRPMRSVSDLWRGVRDVLGEEAVQRLEADGLFRRT